MARVKRPVSKETQADLDRLAKAGALCVRLEADLAAARELRDDLAKKATESGGTRRDVAQAAQVTPGWIQQLIG